MLVVQGIVLTNPLVLHNFNTLHFSGKLTSGDLSYPLYNPLFYILSSWRSV